MPDDASVPVGEVAAAEVEAAAPPDYRVHGSLTFTFKDAKTRDQFLAEVAESGQKAQNVETKGADGFTVTLDFDSAGG